MNIVFMGTPDFAVPCLARLLDDGHNVSGVFSQPDRPKGRGYALASPPVKELAIQRGLPVFQPKGLRDGDALAVLRELSPDLIAVVAYGRLLPPEILTLPPLGCVNVHASLLPKLRGAAPIQWSVINGDTVTGVTTMYMAEGLDTGDMILCRETSIGSDETAGELTVRLSMMGAELLSETVQLLEAGNAPRVPQDSSLSSYASPLTSDLEKLDFTAAPANFCNLVRGLCPSPGARAEVEGHPIKVFKSAVAEGFHGDPGRILDRKRLIVGCGDGAVELITVQPQGKKQMDGAAWLRGRRTVAG